MGRETDIQRNIMRRLIRHEKVAWIYRNNTGKALINGRMVEFGLGKGSSDIIGQLRDGRFLAIEVKTEKGKTTKEQLLFIERVKMWGGVAFIARHPDDVDKELLKNPFTE